MKCDRREFLKWSALLSAASVVGLDLEVPSAFSAEAPDRWVKSVCRYCGAGCGLYIGVKLVKKNDVECGKCALCSFECPLGLTPHLDNHQALCYNCGKCVVACERIRKEKNPLKFKTL